MKSLLDYFRALPTASSSQAAFNQAFGTAPDGFGGAFELYRTNGLQRAEG